MSDLPQLQPPDAHNRKLADNVHPSDWVNPDPDGRYNLVVIGRGPPVWSLPLGLRVSAPRSH